VCHGRSRTVHLGWPPTFFAKDYTVPANTTKKNPFTEVLPIDRGIITRVDLKFPAGCQGLVSVQVYRYEYQIVPLNRDAWVTGDDEVVPTRPMHDALSAPYQLKVVIANEDDTYEHTVSVRVTVESEEEAIPSKPLKTIADFLKRVTGIS